MTLALIDADLVAYRAAAAVERKFEWDGVVTVAADEEEAIKAAIDTANVWAELARCSHIRLLFTGIGNFRYTVLPTYKSNRVKGKPLAYWQTVRAMREKFPAQSVDGLEADDLLGILATTPKYEEALVLSVDKDLKTIPGRHFNPLKDTFPRLVTPAEADRYHLYQALIGDTTDGYKGCPGIGPKKAEAILGTHSGLLAWTAVKLAYQRAGLTEADALQQARVARILRREDYDKTTRTIRLWHPRGEHTPLSLEDVTRKAKPAQRAA